MVLLDWNQPPMYCYQTSYVELGIGATSRQAGNGAGAHIPVTRLRAFTLLEVLMSLTILAVGILAVLGHIATLHSVREAAERSTAVENFANEMMERIVGGRWEILGTTDAPWTLARPYYLPPAGSNPPMSDDATIAPLPVNNLITMGITRSGVGLRNLRVYVDYYRAVADLDDAKVAIPGREGLMDGDLNTYTSLTQVNAIWRNEAALNVYRLDPLVNPTNQVQALHPVLIRITMTSTDLNQPLVYFTARKQ